MPNYQRLPQHVAHLPRHGHDLGQSFAFTSSTGMLLPVYQDFLNPGDSVYINGELFARTQPLATAALADVDVYLDWFFVPMPMLYQIFPSMRWATNDYFSSVFSAELEQYGATLPLTDVNLLCLEINGSIPGSSNSLADSPALFYRHSSFRLELGFDCVGKGTFRLMNHLGFNPLGLFNSMSMSEWLTETNPTVFPMFAMAYQAIFQDYFRVDDYERRDVRSFNADSQFDQQNYPDKQFHAYDSLFELRYRPRHKDYFTGVKASPLTSGLNLLSIDNQNPSDFLRKVDDFLSESEVVVRGSQGGQVNISAGLNTMSATQTSGSQYGSFVRVSSSSLRDIFAVEKLLRIVGRSAKNYDAQVLAHFGYKVPHDVKHQLTHICEQHALLHIGEVVSTANTFTPDSQYEGSALGAISGKGYVNIPRMKKPFKFTAPVDGILMCVYSSVPRYRYYGGFDKINAITDMHSFVNPEYDKLGMQPLFGYENRAEDIGTSNRLGWQYRWSQWKTKYDRVSEAFRVDKNRTNQYGSWVLAKTAILGSDPLGYPYPGNFYASPKDLDSILLMDYDNGFSEDYLTSPWLMFGTDPFINDFASYVKKVSFMSPTGEPDL